MPPITVKFYVWPASILTIAILSGCAGSEAGSGVARTPTHAPATDVGRMEAWRDAEKVAKADAGRATVIGSGESMRPIYGENTVLVISKIAYDDLKPGMQVAYANSAGRRVVHVLLAKDSQGWRVQGLNNAEEDSERVTRGNLIGVVYASFATDEELK